MALVMDPGVHKLVPDGPWIQALRQKANQPKLFIYRHERTKRFVVACWEIEPKVYGQGVAICEEIFTVSDKPDFNPPDLPPMAWCAERCRPGIELLVNGIQQRKEAEWDEERKMVASDMQRDDTVKWLKRQGLEDAARNVQISPYVGEEEAGEEIKAIRDALDGPTKGRIISDPGASKAGGKRCT